MAFTLNSNNNNSNIQPKKTPQTNKTHKQTNKNPKQNRKLKTIFFSLYHGKVNLCFQTSLVLGLVSKWLLQWKQALHSLSSLETVFCLSSVFLQSPVLCFLLPYWCLTPCRMGKLLVLC